MINSSMQKIEKLFEQEGQVQKLDHGHKFLLDDQDSVWFISHGNVDMFLAKFDHHDISSTLHFIVRIPTGNILFAMPKDSSHQEWGLLVRSNMETKIIRLSLSRFIDAFTDEECSSVISGLIENWIDHLTHLIVGGHIPEKIIHLSAGEEKTIEEGGFVCAKKNVTWVNLQKGNVCFLSHRKFKLSKLEFFPVTSSSWLTAIDAANIKTASTQDCFKLKKGLAGINHFHRIVFKYILLKFIHEQRIEESRIKQQKIADFRYFTGAIKKIINIFSEAEETFEGVTDDPLLLACYKIGKICDLNFNTNFHFPKNINHEDKLEVIVDRAKLQKRKVVLDHDWWSQDHGTLLGFIEKDHSPVVIEQVSSGIYETYNPVDGVRERISSHNARKLSVFAYLFYRPLLDKEISLWEVFKLSLRGTFKGISLIILMGILSGLLALVVPIVTGVLFNEVIPSADHIELGQLILALLASGFGVVVFKLTQYFALLRIEGSVDFTIQPALWDRLLRLPVNFFRKFTAGDLAMRINSIETIRQILFSSILEGFLSCVFALFSFMLLFYYSVKLALIATLIIVIFSSIVGLLSLVKLSAERKAAELKGELAGIVSQFIAGITKIRIAGAERKFFAYWAEKFTHFRHLILEVEEPGDMLFTINSVVPLGSSLIIFSVVTYWLAQGSLSVGAFLAFNVAFGTFSAAIFKLVHGIIESLEIIPMYERIKIILTTLPEANIVKTDPRELHGKIELNHIAFAYDVDGPLIINDLSLQIEPGSFVAIVGSSGAGKSTLLRLLLGFDKPRKGIIYFDEHELADLDIDLVRRQIGVVLQNSQLFPGDIFKNIIGSSSLTMDDAWEAARLVGLEQDVKEMPMGMYTFINEGGVGLSGGQKQRILIARAIVHKPKILFFDEATSALDNKAQAIVSESLEGLRATRIVIAHRLSTIINADKIFVLDEGKIIESGNYSELMSLDGKFASFAERQIV